MIPLLTSFLRQPVTLKSCDRFDISCVNIDNAELQYPQITEYSEFPDDLPY